MIEHFIWYMKKGKSITVYPTAYGFSSDDGLNRLWSYAKTKEIRGEDGKLEDMIKKTAEKKKISEDDAKRYLWENEKVAALYLQANTEDMTSTKGSSVVVTAADLKDIIEAATNINKILSGIMAEMEDVEVANIKWNVFPMMFHESEDLRRIGFYQSLKKWCTEKKVPFRSTSVEFMMIPSEEYILMKDLSRSFRDNLQCIVWNHYTGDHMTVAKCDDPEKYRKKIKFVEDETDADNKGSLEMLLKLDKDVKAASIHLSDEEARYLVDTYYQMQEYRKAAVNQSRILDSIPENEPHELLNLVGKNFFTIEKNIKACLEVYASSKPIGKWMMSICGIGPVISAGLMANIDIGKVNTAGAIQRFAGLDPTLPDWEKGKPRPWNARLKVLCWKIGESFIKVSNKPEDIYGKIWAERKAVEEEVNANFGYAEQAKLIPLKKNFKKLDYKKIYEDGQLPPGHINSRARRYAVKIFLSHLFDVWYELYHGKQPPLPYAIGILGHKDKIPVPNWYR